MPSVFRRRLSRPTSRQTLPEDAQWARLAEVRAMLSGADLIREISLVQLRRARLQAGLSNPKGVSRDGH